MSKYNSDSIDECCQDLYGHTNWEYADSSDIESIIIEKNRNKPDAQIIDQVVIFYKHKGEDE